MPDAYLTPDQADIYLGAKRDQLTRAVADGDHAAALDVVRGVRDDGFPTVADEIHDGVVRMLPADTAGLGSTSPEPRPAAVHRWTTACDVAACAACAEGSRPTTEDGE